MSGFPWQDRGVQDWRDACPLANPITLSRTRIERLALALDHDTTFYEIDLSDDARWIARGVTADDMLALRRLIDHFYRWEQQEIDDRHKTVRWEDGDFGSEFITPEEYHRRMAAKNPFPEPRFERQGIDWSFGLAGVARKLAGRS